MFNLCHILVITPEYPDIDVSSLDRRLSLSNNSNTLPPTCPSHVHIRAVDEVFGLHRVAQKLAPTVWLCTKMFVEVTRKSLPSEFPFEFGVEEGIRKSAGQEAKAFPAHVSTIHMFVFSPTHTHLSTFRIVIQYL